MHVTVSFQVSPLVVNVDTRAMNRLLAILNVLMNIKKIKYNDTIMTYLSETPSAGFFTVSTSSMFGNFPLESQDTICTIFGDYLSSPSVSVSHANSVSASSSLQRQNSITSADYQSVNSEGHESFHSIVEVQDTSFVDDDFQSIHESTSHISGVGESDSDSFSSLSGEHLLSISPSQPVARRRNSVFSITSATHSLGQSTHRGAYGAYGAQGAQGIRGTRGTRGARGTRDIYVSLGGPLSEKPGDDYQTIIESEMNDASSISTLSSKKRRMNLNVQFIVMCDVVLCF